MLFCMKYLILQVFRWRQNINMHNFVRLLCRVALLLLFSRCRWNAYMQWLKTKTYYWIAVIWQSNMCGAVVQLLVVCGHLSVNIEKILFERHVCWVMLGWCEHWTSAFLCVVIVWSRNQVFHCLIIIFRWFIIFYRSTMSNFTAFAVANCLDGSECVAISDKLELV